MKRITFAFGLVAALIVAQVILYPTAFGRRYLAPLFYRGGRPTAAGRRLNLAWAWLVANGLTTERWPGHPVIGPAALETRGRKTGEPCTNMVTWVEHDGERYLVSMLGERSDWVRNSRADGGKAAIRRGRRHPVRLEEVPVEERAPIIRDWYRRTASSTKVHMKLETDADLSEFTRIAHAHPVFHIVPVNGGETHDG
jgi:deazaflavin-dependent oxidoreductase (nitroreductase family)